MCDIRCSYIPFRVICSKSPSKGGSSSSISLSSINAAALSQGLIVAFLFASLGNLAFRAASPLNAFSNQNLSVNMESKTDVN